MQGNVSIIKKGLSVFLLLFVSLFIITTRLQAQVITWKVQSNKAVSSQRFALEQAFAKEVSELSDQQLIIKVSAAGGYVPIRSSFNAVRKDVIQAMFMSPMYWGAADPIFYILGDLVAAWQKPSHYQQWLEQAGGINYLHSAYSAFDLKLIGYAISPVESFVSSVPLYNINSFVGKKIRTAPGMVYDYFKLVGAKPRLISLNQVNKALKKKSVTIADYSNIVVNFHDGLHHHIKHTNFPGFHSMPLNDFVVSEKAWASLNTTQQGAVKVAIEHWVEALNAYYQKETQMALIALKNDGVAIYHWNEHDITQARNLAVQVWDSYAVKSDTAMKALGELKLWLNKPSKRE
ncbi:MAG: TRAP transporter substrate-binding protein DctP [Oceanospirillaceae bacterium]|nr:TRAP transporter substrate-binding protein DctP [Oceanospirillaceae bacterium]